MTKVSFYFFIESKIARSLKNFTRSYSKNKQDTKIKVNLKYLQNMLPY